MKIELTPIGTIYTPFTSTAETPIQSSRSNAKGKVKLLPEFVEGLQGIEEFSHIYLIYSLHQTDQIHLLVEPFLDHRKHGIFATRHPFRPNHIGISIVELVSREDSCLHVSGVDMLDQTPLLDIKPFVSDFDYRKDVRSGWYEYRSRP